MFAGKVAAFQVLNSNLSSGLTSKH